MMIGNENALTYESFLRKAFKIQSKGEDPADLASADVYNNDGLKDVKTGASYAMAIFIKEGNENFNIELAEELQTDVLNAKTKEDVIEAIESFKKDVLHKD